MHALGATPVNAVLNTGGWIRPLMLDERSFDSSVAEPSIPLASGYDNCRKKDNSFDRAGGVIVTGIVKGTINWWGTNGWSYYCTQLSGVRQWAPTAVVG